MMVRKTAVLFLILILLFSGCVINRVEKLEMKVELLSNYIIDLEDKFDHQIRNIIYEKEIENIKHNYPEDIDLIKKYLYSGKNDCLSFCDKYAIFSVLNDHIYPVMNISSGNKFYLQVKNNNVSIYSLE